MKLTRIVISILLVATLAVPAMANSDWVEDFLRRYDPPRSAGAGGSNASTTNLGQLLQTGTVPVTMADVIAMMIERNLDIQSNRLAPRSSSFKSLVFYRALQPSIRFAGTVTRNSNFSNTQLNGATVLNQLRGQYAVNFSQALPTGTSLAVDATMNRQSSNSSLNSFNPSYTGQITYTVGQHLLRDRGRLINTHQILIGQNNEKISETQFEIQVTNLLVQESPRRPEGIQIPSLEEAVRVALENRPEMRQADLDVKNKDIDVQYTKNQKLPIFDVTAAYNQNGTGGTHTERSGFGSTQILNTIPGGIWNSFGQLFGYNYTGYSLGFSLVIPLSNKAQQADYDRALTEHRLSESKFNVTAQAIALEVRNALTQVEMNRARIETAQTTRELSEQRLEAEQTKFSLGTSTLRFVLEEQRNVAQAQTNELQNVVNFTKSLVDLDKAMGLSLKKN